MLPAIDCAAATACFDFEIYGQEGWVKGALDVTPEIAVQPVELTKPSSRNFISKNSLLPIII
ncbi:hypothetical protein K0M31_005381 [Melipona bicolor]|uniref:Uncharacterized protein n=1 Tax=Melipona bicolor TaxID=60889 RepID=A0AA40FVX8_9HYME|nr:hypothetical protein K0M31_005381 [Melipona bicolor]